jgi:hypothetical protein
MQVNDSFTIDELTDDIVDNASQQMLRAWAEHFISEHWGVRQEVATVKLSDTVVNTPGALTAIDNLFGTLVSAYRKDNQDPKRVKPVYGNSLDLTIWSDDDTLRYHLKAEARKARDAMDNEAEVPE